VNREPDLLQIVDTLNASRRLASRLHRGQKQADEHADDSDYDQDLDQCEAATIHPLIAFFHKYALSLIALDAEPQESHRAALTMQTLFLDYGSCKLRAPCSLCEPQKQASRR
jgi:hypothetical protein